MISVLNITQIVEQKLCHSCGACFAVCKSDAIVLKETVGGYLYPYVDESKCTHCGLCYLICPGVHFGKEICSRMPEDPFVGESIKAFVGKATDKQIFDNSQSGGIVSALLVHAIQSGRINAAVTAVMFPSNAPRTQPQLARSRMDIIKAQKSKYMPVPILKILKEMKDFKYPIAIVGVACQIHGLINMLDYLPRLRENISLLIGLICERTMTFRGTDYLIKGARMNNASSTVLHFKDKAYGGYPGNVHVTDFSKDMILPSSVRMQIKDFFTPLRCHLCFDKMNVFSDITVGDPHGILGVDRKQGESVAIIRTKKGMQIFQSALTQSELNVREIPYEEILAGQCIDDKRNHWMGYIDSWARISGSIPDFAHKVCEIHSLSKKNEAFERKIRHALSLDCYLSKNQIVKAAERHLRVQYLKKIILFPKRIMSRLFGK